MFYNKDHLKEFTKRYKAANPSFTYKRSSLKALLDLLSLFGCNAKQIKDTVADIPNAKQTKYFRALSYLRYTYPGLTDMPLQGVLPDDTKAVSFAKTSAPDVYNNVYPDGPLRFGPGNVPLGFNRVPVNSHTRHDKTVEQMVNENVGPMAVFLIHVSSFQAEQMSKIFDGVPAYEHAKTVLNAVRLKGGEVCALTVDNTKPEFAVCEQLRDEYDAFHESKRFWAHDKKQHSGCQHDVFVDLADKYDNCVVIGFDGNICSKSNIFGVAEYGDDNKLIKPLVCHANVITSRPLQFTNGTLGANDAKPIWGPLHGV